jgi:hypothetical protein
MAGKPGRSGGHNRRSIADHRFLGTFRPSRHGARIDPPPVPPVPVVKPTTLSAGASVVWDELAQHAIALGTLTVSDARAFSVLCELVATAEWASTQKGDSAKARTLERQTAGAVRPYLEMFGLAGPSSRTRRHVPPSPPPSTPLDKFLRPSKWQGVLP